MKCCHIQARAKGQQKVSVLMHQQDGHKRACTHVPAETSSLCKGWTAAGKEACIPTTRAGMPTDRSAFTRNTLRLVGDA